MTIETKFKPGDDVWFMRDNKPVTAKIHCVRVTIGSDFTIWEGYETGYPDDMGGDSLFPTKAALLASL